MKRLVLVAAVVFATGNALAADLPARPYTKAPPLAAAAFDWSGFYVGGNGGGAWSGKCWDIDPFSIFNPMLGNVLFAGPEGCHTANGATAGGQIGYRWQRAAFVFGVEAQGNWANLTGSNPSQNALFAGFANRSRVDGIGLFTGQVGYAWNAFLLYAKGGAAVAGDKYDSFLTTSLGPLPTGFVADRGSETRWGGVVGIGGEYSFTRNWSFALEYNHLFMGARDVFMTYDPAFVAALNHDEHIRQDVDMVTARINYRFGGPVVARY